MTEFDFEEGLAAVAATEPLVHALTNSVTTNDVAQVVRHWGGLPVMSEDKREVADIVAAAQACLLNTGTPSAAREEAMAVAGETANDCGVPVVLDPVGAGATPTRDRLADRLASDLDLAVIKGNAGEVAALAGEDADVRGVESVDEPVAETAIACARRFDAVVVASGETDLVATADVAYVVRAGHPMMGVVVGTGCMLGATVATMAAVIEDAERAALLGTVAFGLAGELAAEGTVGTYHGPASYGVAFRDAIAGLREADTPDPRERIERVPVGG